MFLLYGLSLFAENTITTNIYLDWKRRNNTLAPRLPYLSPLDFFWGVIKDLVYEEKIRESRHLRKELTQV
jgi:hypothetical protein